MAPPAPPSKPRTMRTTRNGAAPATQTSAASTAPDPVEAVAKEVEPIIVREPAPPKPVAPKPAPKPARKERVAAPLPSVVAGGMSLLALTGQAVPEDADIFIVKEPGTGRNSRQKRSSTSCDQCKKAKSKCDRLLPCTICHLRNLDCFCAPPIGENGRMSMPYPPPNTAAQPDSTHLLQQTMLDLVFEKFGFLNQDIDNLASQARRKLGMPQPPLPPGMRPPLAITDGRADGRASSRSDYAPARPPPAPPAPRRQQQQQQYPRFIRADDYENNVDVHRHSGSSSSAGPSHHSYSAPSMPYGRPPPPPSHSYSSYRPSDPYRSYEPTSAYGSSSSSWAPARPYSPPRDAYWESSKPRQPPPVYSSHPNGRYGVSDPASHAASYHPHRPAQNNGGWFEEFDPVPGPSSKYSRFSVVSNDDAYDDGSARLQELEKSIDKETEHSDDKDGEGEEYTSPVSEHHGVTFAAGPSGTGGRDDERLHSEEPADFDPDRVSGSPLSPLTTQSSSSNPSDSPVIGSKRPLSPDLDQPPAKKVSKGKEKAMNQDEYEEYEYGANGGRHTPARSRPEVVSSTRSLRSH